MPFHKTLNNVPPDPIGAPITVTAARATGPNPLHVSNGALFGSPSPAAPLWVSVFRAGFSITILEVTGNASNVLTVTGAAPSSTDAACNVGDTVMVCPTADSFHELQTALVPATDAQAAFPGLRIDCYGDSLTAGEITGSAYDPSLGYPNQLSLLCAPPHGPRIVDNQGIGAQTSTQISARFLADVSANPAQANDSLVIWAGRNDIGAQATILSNIAAMVAALAPGNNRYLVLGVPPADTETTGSPGRVTLDAVNNALASVYGPRYFDMPGWLWSHYNPAIPQDVIDHGNGITPSSLRSDYLHLNAAGYVVAAQGVFTQLGTLDGPLAPLAPPNLAAILESLDDLQGIDSSGGVIGITGALSVSGKITAATAGATTNSAVQAGSIEIQSYAVGNSWITENAYFDGGAFRYRANGYAASVYFASGELLLKQAPSGTAGAALTWTNAIEIDPAGNVHLIAPLFGARLVSIGASIEVWNSPAVNNAVGLGLGIPGGALTADAIIATLASPGGWLEQARITSANGNLIAKGIITGSSGATGARPTANNVVGGRFYDTTLHKPVWWDGSTWRDASGAVV